MKSVVLSLAVMLLGCCCVMAAEDPGGGETGKKKEEVAGMVLHAETKKPLKDVSVTAYLSSRKEKFSVTDDDGSFSFEDLKPGKYKFVFEKDGFRKVTREAVVAKTDEPTVIDVEMPEIRDFFLQPSPFHFPGY
jgi:hypothetical protein